MPRKKKAEATSTAVDTGVILPTERLAAGGKPPSTEIETIEGFRKDLLNLPKKKICILGTCPSRMAAPFGDLSWEMWTIGPGGKNANRWERLFEIHGNESWPDGFREYMEELTLVKPPKIIYTESPMPMWPANVVIPRDMLFAKYGKMWFSSSIAYALAMALEEGVTHLGCYGIDLESGEEYRSQFLGAKYFIHLARLAGIDITMPKGCGLMRDTNPYPDAWENHLAMTIQAKLEYLQWLVGEKRGQHGELSAQINNIDGEIGAFNFMKEMYVVGGEDSARRVSTEIPKPETQAMLEQIIGMLRSR